mmetsp:Transcript_30207/g.59123  ORF Transcript_30207/g.59123 Transcript_30207/m.59123 type:complete len:301 (+) Transcript_30207:35-937(+)
MFLYILLALIVGAVGYKMTRPKKKERTAPGPYAVGFLATGILSTRTKLLLIGDLLRTIVKFKRYVWFRFFPKKIPMSTKLHLGCGKRHIDGWLNVDLAGSQYDIDLCDLPLPFPDKSFELVASQHVVEHLDAVEELIPALRDLRRCCKDNAQVWISCPDLAAICQSYVEDKGETLRGFWQNMVHLYAPKQPDMIVCEKRFDVHKMPTQFMVNLYMHQFSQHRNLYDYDIMKWILEKSGFHMVERKVEADFLKVAVGFAARKDDKESLYVCAIPDPAWHKRDPINKFGREDFFDICDNPIA